MATADVCVERGTKRVFVSALDWPGWSRSGRTVDEALEALRYAWPRYLSVIRGAGGRASVSPPGLVVVEELTGTSSTDFGVPAAIATADARPATAQEAKRLAAFVSSAWSTFDRAVASATPELRKGPRGGGRDRDAMARHVDQADIEYAKKIGVRLPSASVADRRLAMLQALARPSDGSPLADRGWPSRYAARRIAWHALDHAWEIQERTET